MAEADVRNLEALEVFLQKLQGFQERLGKQQEETRSEMQRATHWIESESPAYWQEQDRLAKRRWVEAREALLQCQAVTRADDHPACTEHRKRLEKWTQRVKLCERQLRVIKQAQLEWDQEVQALRLKLQHVTDIVDSRLPLARHHLDSLLGPLRIYANLRSGSSSKPQANGGLSP